MFLRLVVECQGLDGETPFPNNNRLFIEIPRRNRYKKGFGLRQS
jgi:hypothetical protein